MKRRRPNVVWLPTATESGALGQQSGTISTSTDSGIKRYLVQVPATASAGTYAVHIAPVVGDWSNTEAMLVGPGTNNTFADMYSAGYKLRRLVGWIWPCLEQAADDVDAPVNFVVTAAFQVMQINDAGDPIDAEAGIPDMYGNQGNPWIWRRSWIMTQYGRASNGQPTYGVANVADASLNIRESAFFDAKTARTIGRDQRLFLCMQATALDGDPVGAAASNVIFFTNYRTLGTLTRGAPGNRRHSTR